MQTVLDRDLWTYWFSTASDEAVRGNGTYLFSYNDGTLSPDNYGTLNKWPVNFTPIRLCNDFLENIDQSPITDNLKNQYTAEIKFLRAFYYAELNMEFGGVPIITKAFLPSDNFEIPRNTYDECVDFIIKDLDDAASILKDYPMTGNNVGRATLGSALALKSRVLLHAASPLVNPSMDKSKWQKAADAAKAVIDLGKYSLVANYSDLWLVKRNSEIIMDKAYLSKLFKQQFDLMVGINGDGGWGGNNPTQNLVDDYEMTNGKLPKDDPLYDPQNPYVNRDPRFYASILYSGAPWHGRTYEPWIPFGRDSKDGIQPWCTSFSGYSLRKLVQPLIPLYNSLAGDGHATIFRLGEIYLNYAEAMYQLGGEDVAREYVNKIRQRPSVNMPPITESGDALYKRIQHERRIELAFEEFRYFDVRRWKVAMDIENLPLRGVEVSKKSDGSFTYNYYNLGERKFEEKMYWHPIPRTEIERDPALVQNPGY